MTTERSLLSINQLQKLAEQQPNLTMWMWGNQQPSLHHQEESWPPRTYSCTFCRREFRSAQALGGHMNVHRRDRAKLRQGPASPPPVNFRPLDIIPRDGSCLLYPVFHAGDVSIHSYQFMGPLGNDVDMNPNPNAVDINGDDEVMEEELDLELRLGR